MPSSARSSRVHSQPRIGGYAAHVLEHPGHLLLLGVDARGQQPAQAEGVALALAEGRPLVEHGVGHQRPASQAYGQVSLPGRGIGFRLVAVHGYSSQASGRHR